MEEGVIFDIKDHVGRLLGRYPECLMKIVHDMAEKRYSPEVGFLLSLRIGLSRSIFSPMFTVDVPLYISTAYLYTTMLHICPLPYVDCAVMQLSEKIADLGGSI